MDEKVNVEKAIVVGASVGGCLDQPDDLQCMYILSRKNNYKVYIS